MLFDRRDLDLSLGSGKPLPRRIADLLLSRIFTGEFKPGDKLPPDRLLAEQLGVDRTSLRVALSELAGRGVVRAVRGSGVVVLDYRETAGLDFLDAVLSIPNVDLGGALKLEFLNHWIDVVPAVVKMALSRSMPADLAALDGLIARQLELLARGADVYELALLEVEIQDLLVTLTGSIILRLFANSMHRIRFRFILTFYEVIDIESHIDYLRDLMAQVLENSSRPEEIAEQLREYLFEKTGNLRRQVAHMPQQPGYMKAEHAILEQEQYAKRSRQVSAG